MQIFMFHLMPYQGLAAGFDRHDSAWVTFPNSYYDPEQGARLYETYLDELVWCEELGFDGVCVNEHHQTHYGLMPSPNIVASALIQRTRRVKIAILGNALPLRDHPLRVAEEVAMLDVMSRGRIISGFVRGVGAEYYTFNLDPTSSRERFLEAHDLIVRAWTETGPFCFEGDHYYFRYVNPWPRPYQKPHPPIWIPTMGSSETLHWAAERRYPYLMIYTRVESMRKAFGEYRSIAKEEFGYTPAPDQFGWGIPIYVAESDAAAREQMEPHIMWLFHEGIKRPPHISSPSGYTSEQSVRRYRETGFLSFRTITFQKLLDDRTILCGSPETVVRQIREAHAELDFNILVATLQFGTLPEEPTRRNIRLFAERVAPPIRSL